MRKEPLSQRFVNQVTIVLIELVMQMVASVLLDNINLLKARSAALVVILEWHARPLEKSVLIPQLTLVNKDTDALEVLQQSSFFMFYGFSHLKIKP